MTMTMTSPRRRKIKKANNNENTQSMGNTIGPTENVQDVIEKSYSNN